MLTFEGLTILKNKSKKNADILENLHTSEMYT